MKLEAPIPSWTPVQSKPQDSINLQSLGRSRIYQATSQGQSSAGVNCHSSTEAMTIDISWRSAPIGSILGVTNSIIMNPNNPPTWSLECKGHYTLNPPGNWTIVSSVGKAFQAAPQPNRFYFGWQMLSLYVPEAQTGSSALLNSVRRLESLWIQKAGDCRY